MKYKSIQGLLILSVLCLFGCGSSNSSTAPATSAPEETQIVETTVSSSAEETPEVTTEENSKTEEVPTQKTVDLTGTWIYENGIDENDPYRRIIVIEEKYTTYYLEDKESGDINAIFIGNHPELIDGDDSNLHYKSKSAWIVPKGHYDGNFSFEDLSFYYSDETISTNYDFKRSVWNTGEDLNLYKIVHIDKDEFFNIASILIDDEYDVYMNGNNNVIKYFEDMYGLPSGINNDNLRDSLKKYLSEYNSTGLSVEHDFLWNYCGYLTSFVCNYLDGSLKESDPETYSSFDLFLKYQDVIELTAEELVEALNSNPLRAANTYKGKYILLHAYLNNIDASGAYIGVRPHDKYSFVNIQCFVKNEEQINQIMEMSIGDEIALMGQITEVGEIMGYMIDIDGFL